MPILPVASNFEWMLRQEGWAFKLAQQFLILAFFSKMRY